MPELYVEHGDTAGDRNIGIASSRRGIFNASGTAVSRLNSDKSFVVSKETDIRNKNKMFKGGAARKLPCLILIIKAVLRKEDLWLIIIRQIQCDSERKLL